jgi:Fe-S-cluster containining protein
MPGRDGVSKVLNGVSVDSIAIDQDGNLTVTFDLPVTQESTHYELSLTGKRVFDVYEHPDLAALARRLFAAVRARLATTPDPDMAAVDCGRCKGAACCRQYNVLLSEEDIERLRGPLGRDAFLEKYADAGVDWSGDYRYQLKAVKDEEGERCVFLVPAGKEGLMRCSVYDRRPAVCRDFDMAVCPNFKPLDGA